MIIFFINESLCFIIIVMFHVDNITYWPSQGHLDEEKLIFFLKQNNNRLHSDFCKTNDFLQNCFEIMLSAKANTPQWWPMGTLFFHFCNLFFFFRTLTLFLQTVHMLFLYIFKYLLFICDKMVGVRYRWLRTASCILKSF